MLRQAVYGVAGSILTGAWRSYLADAGVRKELVIFCQHLASERWEMGQLS